MYLGFTGWWKLARTLATVLIAGMLDWTGYAPNVPQGDLAPQGIALMTGPLPALCLLLAIPLLLAYPITRAQHATIRQGVDAGIAPPVQSGGMGTTGPEGCTHPQRHAERLRAGRASGIGAARRLAQARFALARRILVLGTVRWPAARPSAARVPPGLQQLAPPPHRRAPAPAAQTPAPATHWCAPPQARWTATPAPRCPIAAAWGLPAKSAAKEGMVAGRRRATPDLQPGHRHTQGEREGAFALGGLHHALAHQPVLQQRQAGQALPPSTAPSTTGTRAAGQGCTATTRWGCCAGVVT